MYDGVQLAWQLRPVLPRAGRVGAAHDDALYLRGDRARPVETGMYLLPRCRSQTHTLPVDLTLEEIEQIAVQQALQAENGNQKRAAERLGISRTTLWRMLQKETPHPYRR